MNKLLKTELYEMITEGTGSALCDSGGAYGRHWEANQKRSMKDFQSDPEVKFDGDWGYTINIWHILTRDLELDSICSKFNRINTKADNWEGDTYGVSKEGQSYLNSLPDLTIEREWNTYNGESALSQTLQGAWVDINQEKYVLIQIHQGCDVRGGYTDARLFRVEDAECPLLEDVYGYAERNGEQIPLSSMYNGHSLTIDDDNCSGEDYEFKEGDKVELELMQR
jgi:hypothetical protein